MLRGDTRAGTLYTRYRIQFGGACSMSLVDMGRHKPCRSPGPGVRRSLVIRLLPLNGCVLRTALAISSQYPTLLSTVAFGLAVTSPIPSLPPTLVPSWRQPSC
ncbi:hypothetical protein BHE90_000618 [Fusarium euwallaceae]|uniref:Uncharacterized protein n=3 Tax=Fusarium solani species complex TaxID=232080 RepID=A0A3M2SFC5_9HYPO|nr:hypothetical protein CDV36_004052 [Fusarium kuroshium]RSL98889.1 hypothetical protein CDV31_012410 [Fusarium ambrosium]RTE84896.1 hypothetical protein BHE90_000618 [Fusarium euwallaceae]